MAPVAAPERRMPKFILECPRCSTRFHLKRYEPDHRVRCRKCKVVVKVPVVADYLTDEQRARHLVGVKELNPQLLAKLAKRFSVKRLLAFAGVLVLLVAAAFGWLVLKVTTKETRARIQAKGREVSFETIAASNSTSLNAISRGAEWVYQIGDKAEERRVVGSALSPEHHPQFDVAVVRPDGTSREVYRYGPDGVFLVEILRGAERVTLNPPMPIAQSPMVADAKWEYVGDASQEKGWTQGWRLQFEAALDNADVPAGKYRCIRITITGLRGAEEVHERHWFAPGVGCVKRVVKTALGEEEAKLTRYVIK